MILSITEMWNRFSILWRAPLIFAALSMPTFAATCESLSAITLPNTSITLSKSQAPGEFNLPEVRGVPAPNLPAFCRVSATLRPTSDSEIKIEVWLPADWNGKFEANGNGGWSGSISPATLATGLRRGYAVAMTDLGHEGSTAAFAVGHPEKLIDFGYRAAHLMTVTAKAIVAAFYGHSANYSYWNGCSAGGRSAMIEAQRFPNDFDGIIAGAPALNWTGRALLAIWIAQANHLDEASYIPPSKYAEVHSAALDSCDALDGVKDGVIEDPTRCHFDPEVLRCKDADGPACLTSAQVATARAIYSGVTNPRTKEAVAPGFERGSEIGWATMGGPQPLAIGYDMFRHVVFQDAAWNYKALNFDSDVERTMRAEAGALNAMDPNLKPFLSHGKLIQYHGWSDPQIAPFTSVQYFQSVLAAMGDQSNVAAVSGQLKVNDAYRLFMIPGMAHCGGGDGTSTFDMLTALEQWVEKGKAPDQVPASRIRAGKPDRTRPLCPWPQVAVYNGTGSTDEAVNFTCKVH
jgi:feruloyl esterase